MIGTTRGSLRPARRLLIVALCGFLPLAILSGFAIRDAALTYHERDEARLRGTARGLAAVAHRRRRELPVSAAGVAAARDLAAGAR